MLRGSFVQITWIGLGTWTSSLLQHNTLHTSLIHHITETQHSCHIWHTIALNFFIEFVNLVKGLITMSGFDVLRQEMLSISRISHWDLWLTRWDALIDWSSYSYHNMGTLIMLIADVPWILEYCYSKVRAACGPNETSHDAMATIVKHHNPLNFSQVGWRFCLAHA